MRKFDDIEYLAILIDDDYIDTIDIFLNLGYFHDRNSNSIKERVEKRIKISNECDLGELYFILNLKSLSICIDDVKKEIDLIISKHDLISFDKLMVGDIYNREIYRDVIEKRLSMENLGL